MTEPIKPEIVKVKKLPVQGGFDNFINKATKTILFCLVTGAVLVMIIVLVKLFIKLIGGLI